MSTETTTIMKGVSLEQLMKVITKDIQSIFMDKSSTKIPSKNIKEQYSKIQAML